MIVISDTSVITNLIHLNLLKILKELFGKIIIPRKVHEELAKIPNHAALIVKTTWIEIMQVSDKEHFKKLNALLDAGEAEAIVLAIELKADALLIDERKGRKIAQEYGIAITGLLGILVDAKTENLIKEIKPVLDKLIFELGFRVSPKLYQKILEKANE